MPFSSGSSQPRDQTWVSCIVGRFFYCLSHEGSSPKPFFILKRVKTVFSRELKPAQFSPTPLLPSMILQSEIKRILALQGEFRGGRRQW